jgi:hypothetical protein
MTAGALGHSLFVPKPDERDVGPDRRAHGSIFERAIVRSRCKLLAGLVPVSGGSRGEIERQRSRALVRLLQPSGARGRSSNRAVATRALG